MMPILTIGTVRIIDALFGFGPPFMEREAGALVCQSANWKAKRLIRLDFLGSMWCTDVGHRKMSAKCLVAQLLPQLLHAM